MNITFDEFIILRTCAEEKISSQRSFGVFSSFSLGKINKIIKKLCDEKLIEIDNKIYKPTNNGLKILSKFEVNNAIILAAGLSSRFVPISYDKPKALLVVDGFPLIEHLIKKLLEKKITNIYIVIGYKSELFFYLKNKYKVNLVFNPEFNTKNTHASINCVKEYLGNTYILCGDNYFSKNVFHKYEYKAFYASIFVKEKSFERGFILDTNDYIIDTNKPTNNQWVMWGHAYFDKDFSKKFVNILDSYYGNPGIDNYYWETIYIENLDKLKMKALKFPPNVIYEFDSINDLIAYDKDAFKTNNNYYLTLMCDLFYCDVTSFSCFEQIKSGLSNKNFSFVYNKEKYIFRIPGVNAGSYVNRLKEKEINLLANKVRVDETVIYFDDNGYKISKFLNSEESFDFNNFDHCKKLCECIKNLHTVSCGYKFDFFNNGTKLLNMIKEINSEIYEAASIFKDIASKYNAELYKDNWPIALCHNDIYEPNIILNNGKVTLIDWEFAGDNDVGFDVSKLIAYKNLDDDNLEKYLIIYFGREPTNDEIQHILKCALINYYYWIIWTYYMMALGNNYQLYLDKWTNEFYKYLEKLNK